MKKALFIFCLLILLSSCSKKKQKESNPIKTETSLKTTLNLDENSVLKEWVNYYNTKDTSFSIEQFVFSRADTLILSKGNVYGLFDKEFDTIYKDFLVFNKDKQSYIDFDSYNWSIDDDKGVMFSPDQEINWVDIKNKTVNRIDFKGPSQWVEEAFWKNDSTIILLENTVEKKPIITEIKLHEKRITTFEYKKNVVFESEYTTMRLVNKGMMID
ncbi:MULTISPECIES: hypothetical protein [Flavobacterium]|uniref:LPS export ABC transporter protein LptC n=1 Tax=Flavobacterium jumunjinense TaxID=998845 RepID=A0ABV5GK57_9FLAO|nr:MULTISPECIES: hypothetical protein [Flavobacterium]